jgi:hypothetical protein
MPYPNTHSARISEPLPQGSSVFATKQIAPGISIILQRPKSGGSMHAQSYRFSKHQYTAEEAKAWLKKHDISYISFEPASSGDTETRKDIIERITKELSGAIIA